MAKEKIVELRLPSNVESEKVVLGSMLIFPDEAEIALGSLTENDFSNEEPRNKAIFKAMNELKAHNMPIDVQTVINQLDLLNYSKLVDNAYLFSLIDLPITPGNIEHYIEIVKEQSILRQFLVEIQNIEKKYSGGVTNVTDFLHTSYDELTRIIQTRSVSSMRSAKEVASELNERIQKSLEKDNKGLTGLDTGYEGVNKLTHGWQKGDLIILAARPSVGKTALGMNFAFNTAIKNDCTVAFFSLEMPAIRIMERLAASRSYVPNDKIQTGPLYKSDRVKLAAAFEEISRAKLYFDDVPNGRLGDIIAKATKMKKQHPDLGLIVIDYLGRIQYSDKPNLAQRQQEVSIISGQLKTLARQLNLAVLCLCQLNREVDDTENKIPQLSHLRESGSIEQDADIVLLMYRQDYYTNQGIKVKSKKGYQPQNNGEEKQEEPVDTTKSQISETIVNVAKNRNGDTAKVRFIFQRAFSRFDEPSETYNKAADTMDEDSFTYGDY
ncbi:MAG: replicative DNA helicase [Bacilli bacterium]|nr:replicative DNA helicase [Bacilli bacterium]